MKISASLKEVYYLLLRFTGLVHNAEKSFNSSYGMSERVGKLRLNVQPTHRSYRDGTPGYGLIWKIIQAIGVCE